MNALSANIKIVLFKSKTLSNGEHPIMVRIIKDRKPHYKSLGISSLEKDWNEKTGLPRSSHRMKDEYSEIIKTISRQYTLKLSEFVRDEQEFTADVLLEMGASSLKKITVLGYFLEKIDVLKNRGEIGNSKVYQQVYNSLKAFIKKDISFSQLDYNLLVKLDDSYKAKGCSDNYISLNFRTIRALFNFAIAEGYVKKQIYPFDKFKISERYDTSTEKRALSKDAILSIFKLELPQGSMIWEAKQYFLFSYFGQGINFIDIAGLQWKNIHQNRISYKRAKTGTLINFNISPQLQEIINLFNTSSSKTPDSYIFPILNHRVHISPTQQYDRVRKVLRRVNMDLKTIAEKVGIQINLTHYCARHSFATVLKRSGVSTDIISESMGHADLKTTEIYLKSFENSVIDEAMINLL